ncbi:MAG: NfeD family protein [Microthrixaceae bacterium]|jgi:membrane protein implicated in regulation of membrane protease activity|nr:NfeD family protein [Microthrixaceae bacterium]
MDSGDPEVWRWIWLIAAVVFGVGEMAVAGSFFLAPFAMGAAVATVVAFAGGGLTLQWAAFLGVSVATFVALRPMAHKLSASTPESNVGAHRQVGQRARVIEPIDGEHDHGMVQLNREKWRAESQSGQAIPAGTTVLVVEVRGTRVVVTPTDPVGTEHTVPPAS